MTLTFDGRVMVHNPLPTYAVTETAGELDSTQPYVAVTPDDGPGYMGVVVIHGILQTGASNLTDPLLGPMIRRLAAVGFPVISPNMTTNPPIYGGSGDGWGNDHSQAMLEEAIGFLYSDFGADENAGVAIIAASAGAPSGLYWAAQHPTDVACFCGVAAVVHTDHAHTNPGLGASINLAYGGVVDDDSGWEAAKATRDPFLIAPSGAYDGLRAHFWTMETDELIALEDVQTFAGEIGGTAEVTVVPGGHPDYTRINRWQIANFVIGSYPATAATRTIVT